MEVVFSKGPVDPADADLLSNRQGGCVGYTALGMISGEAGICMLTTVTA